MSIDTLDRSSIDSQLTPHLHLSWHLIGTWLTSQLTAGWESTNFWLTGMSQSTLRQLSMECWLSVNQDVERDVACGLIEGIDRHSTVDAISIHDLRKPFLRDTCMFEFRFYTVFFCGHEKWFHCIHTLNSLNWSLTFYFNTYVLVFL